MLPSVDSWLEKSLACIESQTKRERELRMVDKDNEVAAVGGVSETTKAKSELREFGHNDGAAGSVEKDRDGGGMGGEADIESSLEAEGAAGSEVGTKEGEDMGGEDAKARADRGLVKLLDEYCHVPIITKMCPWYYHLPTGVFTNSKTGQRCSF